MEFIESIYASGRIVYLILVPILREISAVLFAFAISKDCKARDNGSGVLWGIFTLITPFVSGIIYFIYSRILVKRKAKTRDDEKDIKRAYKFTIAGVIIYTLSIITAVLAIIASLASGIALFSL